MLAAALLLTAGAIALWFPMVHEPLPEPPHPQNISDPEVSALLETFREKVLANPSDGLAWGEYGTVLLANLFDQPAEHCFRVAMKLSPQDPRWPYARGQIALKRKPEAAPELLRLASERAQADPYYLQSMELTYADVLLEQGQTEQAAALFEKHQTPPDPERAAYGLGLIALERGEEQLAQHYFEKAVQHPCARKQAKVQLAILARRRGDLQTAKQLESEAGLLEADPPWPDPYLDRVVKLQVGMRGLKRRIALLERDHRFEEALELYREQVRQKPTSSALTGMGVNLARLARYDEALVALREAVQRDATDSNAHYSLALVLFTKWEVALAPQDDLPEEARAAFREVVEHTRQTTKLKPDHARAYLFWGLALKYLGEPRAALDPLRRGLTIEPQLFELHLALGQCLAALGDIPAARSRLEAAKQLRPDDPRPDAELAKLGPTGD
jgi:tetratricopeptide (TPR) repeat protein